MPTLLRRLLKLLSLLALGALAVGYLMPLDDPVMRTVVFTHTPPETLWPVVADHSIGQLRWRTDLDTIYRLPPRNGHPVVKEVDRNGRETVWETIEQIEPTQLKRMVVDSEVWASHWTVIIVPHWQGSRVTFMDDRRIYNPLVRLYVRLFKDKYAHLDQYIADLRRYLKE